MVWEAFIKPLPWMPLVGFEANHEGITIARGISCQVH